MNPADSPIHFIELSRDTEDASDAAVINLIAFAMPQPQQDPESRSVANHNPKGGE